MHIRFTQWIQNKRGASLIETMVASGVMIIAVFSFLALELPYRMLIDVSLTRSLQVHSIAIDTAKELQDLDYNAVRAICEAKGALNTTVPGNCIVSDKLNPDLKPSLQSSAAEAVVVEVLRNWQGFFDDTGKVCIALLACAENAHHGLMQITLGPVWQQGHQVRNSKTVVFNRSRW